MIPKYLKSLAKITLAFLSITLAACATGAPKAEIPVASKPSVSKPKTKKSFSINRSDAYQNFIMGLLAERRGSYGEAIAHYRKAARYDTRLVQAYERLSTLFLRLGNLKKAESAALEGLKIDEKYAELLEIAGGIYSSTGQHDKAISYFDRLIKVEPDNKNAKMNLAVSMLNSGRYKESISLLDEYTKKYKVDPSGPYHTGIAYMRQEKWDKAITSFKLLTKRFPDFLIAYQNLGWIYNSRGWHNKAAEVYSDYLLINPNSFEAQTKLEKTKKLAENKSEKLLKELLDVKPKDINLNFRLGILHWRRAEVTGQLESFHKALDQFQLVRAGNPDDRRAVFYIANIFERLNLNDEAIQAWKRIVADVKGKEARDIHLKIAELYERAGKLKMSLRHSIIASDLDPQNPDLKYFIGLLQNKLNNLDEAEAYFYEAIKLKEDDKYYFFLGVIYEKMGRIDDSIDVMKKAIELKPDHSNALNYLGYLYAEQGINLNEAEEHIDRALELEPENGYFLDSIGWIYYKQKQYKKAATAIESAVRNIPPDPTVLDHLGDVYTALDKPLEAADAYERSLKAKAEDDRQLDREAIRKKLEKAKKLVEERKLK